MSSSSIKSFLGLRISGDGALSYTFTDRRHTVVCVLEKDSTLPSESSLAENPKSLYQLDTGSGSDKRIEGETKTKTK